MGNSIEYDQEIQELEQLRERVKSKNPQGYSQL